MACEKAGCDEMCVRDLKLASMSLTVCDRHRTALDRALFKADCARDFTEAVHDVRLHEAALMGGCSDGRFLNEARAAARTMEACEREFVAWVYAWLDAPDAAPVKAGETEGPTC